jgi:putative endonuclease
VASGEPAFFVYIVRCADDSLYTGWTTDVERRVRQHNRGRGAKYTRTRGPVTLVYTERQPSRSAAMQREYQLKQLTRPQKLALIEEWVGG